MPVSRSMMAGVAIPVKVDVLIEPGTAGERYTSWASLRIEGVTVFRAEVYDSNDRDGGRSPQQAVRNLLLLLQAKAQRLLEDES